MSTAATTSNLRDPLAELSLKRIMRFWWPLAASWLLMAFDAPSVSAAIARLPNEEIHLGAYGAVFGISLITESPIIMALAASTALSRDWPSYLKLRRFFMRLSAAMTLVHILIAFTPLFEVVFERLIGLPDPMLEPARLGIRIMVPWTWSIGYRRFNQGVLIRFDHTRSVGIGTAIRLVTLLAVLAIGLAIGTLPGIAVGALAIIAGVIAEAIYIGIRVRPVLRDELQHARVMEPPLDLRRILNFYTPLMFTSFIALLVQPIGSAALSRARLAEQSLALWTAMNGLVFMARSLSVAYNEVVIAQLDRPNARPALKKFATLLMAGTGLALLLVAVTPLSDLWFGKVSDLNPELVALARTALPIAVILPMTQAWGSYYQGTLTYKGLTGAVTESVAVYLLVISAVLWMGVRSQQLPGIQLAWIAFGAGQAAQVAWLWMRNRQHPFESKMV